MHNPNPTEIALEECTHVWRSKPRRDIILSFGTGVAPHPARPVDPSRGGFTDSILFRIARWSRSRLSQGLDPQVVHRRVRHTLYWHDRPSFDRYFRLNLDLPGPLPRMDDVTCMAPLMTLAAGRSGDPIFQRIKSAMIASSFFFELDRLPTPANAGRRLCIGSIRVRGDPTRVLNLLPGGHTARVRFTKDDEDLAVGRASDWLCPTCGRFNLPVRFLVSSMIDPVSISLRLGQGGAHHISGFPQELGWFIREQRLHDVFFAPPSLAVACVCRTKAGPRPLALSRKRAAPRSTRAMGGKRRRQV